MDIVIGINLYFIRDNEYAINNSKKGIENIRYLSKNMGVVLPKK